MNDHQMFEFLARWSTEVITGLIAVLLILVKWIGKNKPYATHQDISESQDKLLNELKQFRAELMNQVQEHHKNISHDIDTAHKRIDEIYTTLVNQK